VLANEVGTPNNWGLKTLPFHSQRQALLCLTQPPAWQGEMRGQGVIMSRLVFTAFQSVFLLCVALLLLCFGGLLMSVWLESHASAHMRTQPSCTRDRPSPLAPCDATLHALVRSLSPRTKMYQLTHHVEA
jgi:hypothetical protein